MSAMPIVVDEVTAYVLSCVPPGVPDYEQFRVLVRKRERWGGWTVIHLDTALTTDGHWVLCSSFMAGKYEEYAKRTGFATAEEALIAARNIAPHVKNWDGQTVADVLPKAASEASTEGAAS